MSTYVSKDGSFSALSVPAPLLDRHQVDSHAHSVQFYTDDTLLLDELGRFVGSALGAGDAAIVIATPAHRDGLAQRLKARGLNLALAAKQGHYTELDAAQVLDKFMLEGMPDADLFSNLMRGVINRASATSKGEPLRVAIFGEMVALLWAEGRPEAALRLEQLWNDLAEQHPLNLRCAYPMSFFSRSTDSDAMGKICEEHRYVIPAEGYTELVSDDERLRAITIWQQKAQALEAEVAERKRIETALREAVALREEFMSVAAHELKTPITGLRGFTQLLLRDARLQREIAPERFASALKAIELQTEKITRLVARLLDSAQIEAGKLRIERERTDLVALVRSALAQQYDSAGRSFVFDGPEHLEAEVDAVRIEQVIVNLLSNAIKFSPHGSTITIGLEQHGDSIKLSVTNQGTSIPPEEREKIFERFHQARYQGCPPGMGLGLYIAREIVQLHGGSITVEEPEQPGARFVVTLPA